MEPLLLGEKKILLVEKRSLLFSTCEYLVTSERVLPALAYLKKTSRNTIRFSSELRQKPFPLRHNKISQPQRSVLAY
jgi:hypothetical protein